jgi:quercetin dioxygenase-like cupin family protein
MNIINDGHPTPTSRHAYLETHQISGRRLRFGLTREDAVLRDQASASKTGRAGQTLVKEGSLRITQLALRKGSALGSHQIAGAVSMQMLRGRLRVTTTDGAMTLESGDLIALGVGVGHDTQAVTDCVVLITMAMQQAQAAS